MTVIGIFGPTASGKSAVAMAVAERIPAGVVSADAMQLYEGLPILTNRSGHPERLVGIWPLSHTASVGEYAPLAHAAIDEILAAGRTPLVVGGTGLYFRAALAELALPPAPAPGARERWSSVYDEEGAEAAHRRLAELDPDAAGRVHANDRRRVVRALELAEAGGSLAPGEDRLFAGGWRHPTLVVALAVPKAILDRRIAERAWANVRVRGRGGGAAGAAGTRSRRPRARRSASTRSPPSRARRPRRPSSGARAATPRTSASGCAAWRRPLSSPATGRPGRSPMRSSRWHAHGNVYIVHEGDGSGVDAAGTDGVAGGARGRRATTSRSGSSTPTAPAPRCPATARASPRPG